MDSLVVWLRWFGLGGIAPERPEAVSFESGGDAQVLQAGVVVGFCFSGRHVADLWQLIVVVFEVGLSRFQVAPDQCKR